MPCKIMSENSGNVVFRSDIERTFGSHLGSILRQPSFIGGSLDLREVTAGQRYFWKVAG